MDPTTNREARELRLSGLEGERTRASGGPVRKNCSAYHHSYGLGLAVEPAELSCITHGHTREPNGIWEGLS